MLHIGSFLLVADNSGAKFAKCLRIYGKGSKQIASLGDSVRVTLYKLNHKKKLKKKVLYNAIVISVKKQKRRYDDTFIKFNKNRVVILSETNKFLGTRIYGPICKEIRGGTNELKYKKIISCSSRSI